MHALFDKAGESNAAKTLAVDMLTIYMHITNIIKIKISLITIPFNMNEKIMQLLTR